MHAGGGVGVEQSEPGFVGGIDGDLLVWGGGGVGCGLQHSLD